MGVVRSLRAHLDTVVAVLLAVAFLVEVYLAEGAVVGDTFVSGLELDDTIAVATGVVFLLSLVSRTRLPLLPLALAFGTLALTGQAQFDRVASLAIGVVLTSYSVGAWAGGRAGQVGALGVGALAGVLVIRASTGTPEPRELAAPLVVLLVAWLVGLAVRSFRVDRGDARVRADVDWETASSVPDSAGRDEIVRELRDVVERALSAVVLQSRQARAWLQSEPARAERALGIVDAAATEALQEAQRLTGLLLSPDGTPLPEPQPGLADLDFLAEQVSDAGLPVNTRLEGRPLPLRPDLDAVAYRVVHEALMATLNHATATLSNVVIRYQPDELQVEIADDGLGLDRDDAEQERATLESVRDEVAALGGTLDAGPGEEAGYWVLARLPYEPDWT